MFGYYVTSTDIRKNNVLKKTIYMCLLISKIDIRQGVETGKEESTAHKILLFVFKMSPIT